MATIKSEPTSLKPGRENQLSGRPCPICTSSVKICAAIDELLLKGEKVTAVMRWAQKKFPAELAGIAYDSFSRHQRLHVKGMERAVRKLSDHARLQRQKVETAKAVLADEIDPQSFFSPAALAVDISRTEKRLDTAAGDAAETRQHSALASLSGALIRSYELRGKLGGSVRPEIEVNISLGLEQLHGRLDSLVGAPTGNRQGTARSLLGLAPPTDDPLPDRRRPIRDLDELTNPGGGPLTIDADPVGAPSGRVFEPSEAPNYHPDPETRLASPAGDEKRHSTVDPTVDSDSGPGTTANSWGSGENLGTRWR